MPRFSYDADRLRAAFRPYCALCRAPITSWEIAQDILERHIIIRVHCHGMQENVSIAWEILAMDQRPNMDMQFFRDQARDRADDENRLAYELARRTGPGSDTIQAMREVMQDPELLAVMARLSTSAADAAQAVRNLGSQLGSIHTAVPVSSRLPPRRVAVPAQVPLTVPKQQAYPTPPEPPKPPEPRRRRVELDEVPDDTPALKRHRKRDIEL